MYARVNFFYCVSSTLVVLCGGKFFCKKKCNSSGQKDNAETAPVLKKIYIMNNASDVLVGYFFSVVRGVVNMAYFQLMHV